MNTIQQQIRDNAVALISLVMAIIALSYSGWRNETSEAQRNIRLASFKVLESLGELQEVADYRYYYFAFETDHSREGELRLRGYGSVAMVRDLMNLMPEPAPAASNVLFQVWNAQVNVLTELDEAGQHSDAARLAEKELSSTIKQARDAVIKVLESLE